MSGTKFGATVLAAVAASLLLASSASAFKPLVGTYVGTTPGTSTTGQPTTNTLSVRLTNKQKRTFKTTLTAVVDDCAGGFVVVPLPLGRLFAKDFKYSATGTSGSVSYSVSVGKRLKPYTKARTTLLTSSLTVSSA